jgi:hypothetical protein
VRHGFYIKKKSAFNQASIPSVSFPDLTLKTENTKKFDLKKSTVRLKKMPNG